MKAIIAMLALAVQPFSLSVPVSANTDTTSPMIVDILPTTGTVLGKGSVTFTVRAYDEHPGQLTLTLGDEETIESTAPSLELPNEEQQTNMNAALTIDTNNFPDGSYVLHVKATDEAGNSAERMARYSIDKEAPSTPVGGTPDEMVRRVGDVLFAWNEVSDSTSSAGIRYDLRASQSSAGLESASQGNGSIYQTGIATSTFTAQNVAAGTWYWQVRAVDAAGNVGGWSDMWRVTLDDMAPVIEVSSPSESVLVASNHPFMIEATANDNEGLNVYGAMVDGIEIKRITQPENGVMEPIAIDLTTLGDGEHILTVFALDKADIRSEVVRTFTLDATAPIITTPVDNNQVMRGTARITMESVDAHPDIHGMTVVTSDGVVVAEGEPVLSSTGVLYYDWDTTRVANGTYSLHFTSTDAVGNKTTLERLVRVENQVGGMGTVLPSVPLVEPLDVELSQPRLLGVVTPPIGVHDVPQNTSLEATSEQATDPSNAQPETIPVQPTENGWQLFGILWYWWALMAGGIGAASLWGWRTIQNRLQV